MDIQTLNTPEKLYQAIVKFLESDYSHEDLVETYNDARKCVIRFRGDYSALLALPVYKDNALDGLQDVMDWCIKSSEVVDNMIFNLERQIINEVISQFKKLRDLPSSRFPPINNDLLEQAKNEARIIVEKKRKKPQKTILEIMADTARELEKDALVMMRYEVQDKALQIYLSKDPTFNDRLLQLHKEICEVFGKIKKLVSSNTPTGKLLDIYCKLKEIPIQQRFNDVCYAFGLNSFLHSVMFGNSDMLYATVDIVINLLEEIQTKIEKNPEHEQVKDNHAKAEAASGRKKNEEGTKQMDEQKYKEFLVEIAQEIGKLAGNSLTQDKFHAACDAFCEQEDGHRAAFEKAAKKAKGNPQLRDENQKPNENMVWYNCTKSDYRLNGFWSEPLPFSPDAWISFYYNWVYAFARQLFFATATEPTNSQQKLTCDYTVLGLIRDKILDVPKCDRLCTIDDEEWRWLTWDSLQLNDLAAKQHGYLAKLRLKEAIARVKADLGTQEKPKTYGDLSKPMTKSKMMSILGIDGYKKFNTFAKQHGLHKAGNRQLWQICLDSMDKNTRQKLEKA